MSSDHDHVGLGVARHHAQQHALAHAGAGEQADALAAAHREQGVDRAHTGVQRRAHRIAVHGVEGRAVHRFDVHVGDRAHVVHGVAVRVDHAAQQALAQRQPQRATVVGRGRFVGLSHTRHGAVGRQRRHAGTAGEAVRVARGHEKGAVVGEAHHLGQHRRLAAVANQALRTHRHLQAHGFEHQTGQAGQRAAHLQRRFHAGVDAHLVHEMAPAAVGAKGAVRHRRLLGSGSRPRSCRGCPRRATSVFRSWRPPPRCWIRSGSHRG